MNSSTQALLSIVLTSHSYTPTHRPPNPTGSLSDSTNGTICRAPLPSRVGFPIDSQQYLWNLAVLLLLKVGRHHKHGSPNHRARAHTHTHTHTHTNESFQEYVTFLLMKQFPTNPRIIFYYLLILSPSLLPNTQAKFYCHPNIENRSIVPPYAP